MNQEIFQPHTTIADRHVLPASKSIPARPQIQHLQQTTCFVNRCNDKLKQCEMIKTITKTDSAYTTLLIRLMVGVVFLSEGIQKFLFPAIRGTGRFEKIGLPAPEFLGTFVGSTEILCGILILLGLFTRLAAIPTLIIMIVAILTTKLDILANQGIWEMLHAARTDWAMLLGSIFLIIKGGGFASADYKLFR
jgi:putative oxidoreductase